MAETREALPRWSLAGLCGFYALTLLWCAAVLPWRSGTLFSVLTSVLGISNAVVAVLAGLRHRWLSQAWRGLAWATLSYFLWLAWQVVTSALYLHQIYGSLGTGIGLLLVLALGLFAAVTLPVAVWWFVRQRRHLVRERRAATAVALLLATAFVVRVAVDEWAPRSLPVPDGQARAVAESLRTALARQAKARGGSHPVSLFAAGVAECSALDASQATALVSFVRRGAGSVSACVRASPGEIVQKVAALMAKDGEQGPVKVDILTSAQVLRAQPGPLGPLGDSLAVRPGLDGLCLGRRCLAPWQLVAHGAFATEAPLPFADQLKMGVSFQRVSQLFGAAALNGPEGLLRVETKSFVLDTAGDARGLVRGVQVTRDLTPKTLVRAERAALKHAERAQHRDGTFRYQFDMFSGNADSENPSIPRHAGMVLALCEFSKPGRRVEKVIRRGLGAMARWERRAGHLGALVRYPEERVADLGSSALGLVALVACRRYVGDAHDALIGRLGRLLLALENDAGHFEPGYDFSAAKVVRGPTPLFAGGQAIYALSLLEKLAHAEPSGKLPSAKLLNQAVERGMNYVVDSYWPKPLSDFFYLKENWHCLAARASLSHHRNDGYERFCLDYIEFKTGRFVVDASSGVDPDYYGGFNFSNLAPPHNGSSAGVGEALAAAIEIKRARGEDVSALLPRLERVLGFLLQRQLLDDNCFACEKPKLAIGGFTGESVGPVGRIDHTQHALSAIGSGARQLSLNSTREPRRAL